MSRQLKAKLEEQRKRLLDLTSRNKLLNYKHAGANPRSKRQSYLRIVDEIPEFIIERLDPKAAARLREEIHYQKHSEIKEAEKVADEEQTQAIEQAVAQGQLQRLQQTAWQ